MAETITLQIPDTLYQRLANTASTQSRSLEEVMVHALHVGSPPEWEDVPEEFQADVAALDKLDDNTLWEIAYRRKSPAEMERYNILLAGNQNGTLSEAERLELMALRVECDRFMLCKAQAAVLRPWRGHRISTP